MTLIMVDDPELKIDIKGKLLSGDDPARKPLTNVKVNLLNKTSEIIQSSKTDKDGLFEFKYLGLDQSYIIGVDETDPQISSLKKLILADEKGKTVKEVQADKNKHFRFELLPNDINKMEKIYVDDPWLKIMEPKTTTGDGLVISENVYFNVNDEKLLPDAKQTLDKVIAIMNNVPGVSIEISSHTDSQGADDYNLKLSERRAKAAVDYMTTHGLSATRVTGKGYGETRLLNKCANGVKCSEEEHAKNRRLEFKVIKK
jgi:outer membrane protein OmpA-like peptidoglycan-associated protein